MENVRVIIVGVMVLAFVLAGCNGDDAEDTPSPEQAQANLCESLDSLQSDLSALTDISSDTTMGDLQDEADQIRDDLESVQDDAEAVSGAETQQLQSAFNDLVETVDSIDSDTSASQAVDSIQAGVADVADAWQELFDFANCQS